MPHGNAGGGHGHELALFFLFSETTANPTQSEDRMRTSTYYGREHGARVIELRPGNVSSVEIGTVDHTPPDEVPTRGLLTFRLRSTISGKPARELGAALSAIARGEAAGRLALYDALLARF
jgi:hypothetical protein